MIERRCMHDGALCQHSCEGKSCSRAEASSILSEPWSYIEQYEYQVENLWSGDNNTLRELFIICVGMAGELGEAAECLVGLMDDPNSREKNEALLLELGDILYYTTKLMNMHGWSLTQVISSECFVGFEIEDDRLDSLIALAGMCRHIGQDVLEPIKKLIRDDRQPDREKLFSGFTLVLGSLCALAKWRGTSLEDVMRMNIDKLDKKWASKC